MDFPNFLWLREFRWKQGRESFAQYCLACLFLGKPPIGWNKPQSLSPKGRELLHRFHEEFDPQDARSPDFYWEFNLGKLPDDKENGWPDLVALSDERVLVMELKTEAGSHRDGQVDWYMRLAAVRFFDRPIQLIYLTVDPVSADPSEIPEGATYRNLLWTDVADMIDIVWKDGNDEESWNARLFSGYLREITRQTQTPSKPAPSTKHQPPPQVMRTRSEPFSEDMIEELMAIYRLGAKHVLADGKQRALELTLDSLEEAKEIQRAITAQALLDPVDSPVHGVTLWVWRQASKGTALSEQGRLYGVELRVSKKTAS